MNGPLPPLDDAQIAAYAREAGFWGDNLVTMVAVILAESGGDPDNVGDEGLANKTWGPSIGLAQVRSLRAETGTGGPRDATRLTDPAFNLRSAWTISAGGTNFRPWSVWSSLSYRRFLDRARAAVANAAGGKGKGAPVQGFLPLPGLDSIGNRVVEPLTEGLARLALVGVLLAGGVALVGAGAWRSTSAPRQRARQLVDDVAGDVL